MSLRLSAAGVFLPPFLKKRYLGKLFRLTAEAFEISPPDLEGASEDARLRLYASFTRANAMKVLAAGNAEAVGERLYRNARAFGEELRRSLGVRSLPEAMAAARLLYRAIGIDFVGARTAPSSSGPAVSRRTIRPRSAASFRPSTGGS